MGIKLSSVLTYQKRAYQRLGISSQRQLFDSTLSAPTVAGAQAQVQQALSLTPNSSPGAEDPVIANAKSSLYDVVNGVSSVEAQLVTSVIDRSTTLRNNAIRDVITWGSAVVLVLVIVLPAPKSTTPLKMPVTTTALSFVSTARLKPDSMRNESTLLLPNLFDQR